MKSPLEQIQNLYQIADCLIIARYCGAIPTTLWNAHYLQFDPPRIFPCPVSATHLEEPCWPSSATLVRVYLGDLPDYAETQTHCIVSVYESESKEPGNEAAVVPYTYVLPTLNRNIARTRQWKEDKARKTALIFSMCSACVASVPIPNLSIRAIRSATKHFWQSTLFQEEEELEAHGPSLSKSGGWVCPSFIWSRKSVSSSPSM